MVIMEVIVSTDSSKTEMERRTAKQLKVGDEILSIATRTKTVTYVETPKHSRTTKVIFFEKAGHAFVFMNNDQFNMAEK